MSTLPQLHNFFGTDPSKLVSVFLAETNDLLAKVIPTESGFGNKKAKLRNELNDHIADNIDLQLVLDKTLGEINDMGDYSPLYRAVKKLAQIRAKIEGLL